MLTFSLAVTGALLSPPHIPPTVNVVQEQRVIAREYPAMPSTLLADANATPKKLSKAQAAQQKLKAQQKADKEAELGVSLIQSFDPSFDKQAARAKAINAAAAAKAAAANQK